MKISYNWLNKYLPETIEPQKLSEILTSVGLEVEALEPYENFKGGLKGLVTGEVLSCEQHPNADKLKITKVDINKGEPLQIVCGAPNVAAGQKVIVAPVGTTIFPLNGEAVTMKVAKIRGVESFGMICAEDEIGLSNNHEGILILPAETENGTPVEKLFDVYADWIYEIGLTPNRMDAMSHIGVAKDVCAWLSYHNHTIVTAKLPFSNNTENISGNSEFTVTIENTDACKRYSGVAIKNVKVAPSPAWLQNYLKAIGQRPINNIVDITNFILHETGQPLHAFDAHALSSKKIVIKNLPEGTLFKTLDEVERKLGSGDLMICNDNEPVCIAGVFGGIGSSVTEKTQSIFLESAWFSPTSIRATSLKHGLRTEAAIRFEKGVDISGTVRALLRAIELIKEVAGGEVSGKLIDVYPVVAEKKIVVLKYDYLKKLSGKVYSPESVKNILTALEFDILEENNSFIKLAIPLSKADISLPADIVEEIIRIDGLNNIEIPSTITITPSINENSLKENLKEKLAQLFAGLGFNEIITNSIANSKNYSEEKLNTAVRLLNNLSADLDIMRPSMLETGLEVLSYNVNRKNTNLRFFELGKVYKHNENGYLETEKLCFWITGRKQTPGWKNQNAEADFFTAKGITAALLENINIRNVSFGEPEAVAEGTIQTIQKNKTKLGSILLAANPLLQKFGIKQPVIFAELDVEGLAAEAIKQQVLYKEIPPFPVVERDLAFVTGKNVVYGSVASLLERMKVKYLESFKLFDIYEGEKLGADKKSFAINFRFINAEKTLTDAEVELAMKAITEKLAKEFDAEIRH
ncbi:phenylalanine--tRNA ligase subunit beta [Parafilimonas terrae]|uniref:Phenylalanine--tRNA ligase beta subunit n=1 Tax=Parafilimonas terrae TaxID=1465490 RepID=A0A1I5RXG5_9BACT|nr:phenylalanine--tRNA ligase subunit beta [Parafilimonas terrae]SFP63222.1 phenylalanyl-tRNA synthetase beta subunit [Parafilimonas terrae]